MSCSPLKGCWIIAGHELEVSVTLVGDANTLLSCVHGKKNWKKESYLSARPEWPLPEPRVQLLALFRKGWRETGRVQWE